MDDRFPFTLGPRRERGFLLTFVLLAAMIFSYGASFSLIHAFITGAKPQGSVELDTRLLPYYAALFLLNGTGALGLWLWRRWGLYLFGFSMSVMLLANFSAVGIFFYGAPVLLLVLLIRRKWRHFE